MRERDESCALLTVPDAARWRDWLIANAEKSDGVWLVLAKKDVTTPTSLTYQQALEEALCSGWIDGQRRSADERTFLQRFTPRRQRSVWSRRNVDLVAGLAEEGRLRTRGLLEIDRAKADGRWDRAYAGQSSARPPAALTSALDATPGAAEAFERLSRGERYKALHPVFTAPNETVERRRIERLVARLAAS